MNRDLGNCPFCLSAAVGLYIGGVQPNCIYKAHCKNCRASGPPMNERDMAVLAWNNCMDAVSGAYQYGAGATPLDILVERL